MSQRQHERASRFQVNIEDGVRAAAIAFRDNDIDASIVTVTRLWWTSGLRGRCAISLIKLPALTWAHIFPSCGVETSFENSSADPPHRNGTSATREGSLIMSRSVAGVVGGSQPAPGASACARNVALIWSIAELLRGDYKQHEYGQVILPFTLLRRLDCVLAPTKGSRAPGS